MCPLYDHTPSGFKNIVNSNYIVSLTDPKLLHVINLKIFQAVETVAVLFLINTGLRVLFFLWML
jgi:hypothetical protein